MYIIYILYYIGHTKIFSKFSNSIVALVFLKRECLKYLLHYGQLRNSIYFYFPFEI